MDNKTTVGLERIAAAAQALKVSAEEIEKTLDAIGVEEADFDDDSVFKFTDFREKLADKPIAAVRKAFGRLRASATEAKSGDPRLEQLKALGLKVRLEDADSGMLLPLYEPGKPNDPISQALRKRFNEKPVIAFKDDGSVAVTESLRYIADLEQGYAEAEAIMVDGKLARLWAVGTKPNMMVEEDPLFPGKALRSGYSTVNNRNWGDVPHRNRVFCRIVVERGEIDVNNKDAVLRLIERATTPGLPTAPTPSKSLVDTYPEADLEYRERQSKDNLPKLKVELGSLTKPNNPFGVRRQY